MDVEAALLLNGYAHQTCLSFEALLVTVHNKMMKHGEKMVTITAKSKRGAYKIPETTGNV